VIDLFSKINIYTLSRPTALIIATIVLAAVVTVDYITSFELSLSAFYLLGILIVSWNCGWRWGIAFAVISFMAQLEMGFADNPYSEPVYLYIGIANTLIAYLLVVGLTVQLRYMYDRERSTARVDSLTGALNYLGFQELLEREMERHRRQKQTFSVAYIDCDNFKAVNDRFGHSAGDRLLHTIAATSRSALRKTDIVARIGGDEFAVVLVATGQPVVMQIAEKMRQALDLAMKDNHWPVTFSIGVAVFDAIPETVDQVVSASDHLMYEVKKTGKNGIAYSSLGSQWVGNSGDIA
jgi:diguanylate cyclase (GGDEF)-like protein